MPFQKVASSPLKNPVSFRSGELFRPIAEQHFSVPYIPESIKNSFSEDVILFNDR